jgi:hypothetical protein
VAFTPDASTWLTDFFDIPRPLPRVLWQQGYATEFVGSGDLNFLREGEWLRAMGFQKIIGVDDPRFAPEKIRGPFNSVLDRALYRVSLEEVTQMATDRPYFMVVQTFWSHTPFMAPDGSGRRGEELCFRETDAQIGAFYERLSTMGFFQRGLLFVTGDHRAMSLFRKKELERYGASADARIPAVVVTHAIKLPPAVAQDFQQRDFAASIEALVGDRYCLGPYEGSFLTDPPTPPGCIMHARGDDRDLIFVKCGAAEGIVRAAGDATKFVGGGVPDEASIIRTINRSRARLQSPGQSWRTR